MTMNDRQADDEDTKRDFICGVVEGFYGKPWSFEQRKDLFKQLKQLKLNSFMYAPKDDTKHRAKWRQPYSEAEARALKELIDEAEACGINFYYSLAPGLDMIYSDKEEIRTLIRKYDQLVGLGCKSFAILFDDIEPDINARDKEVFKDYASAQIFVSNIVFEHLNKPEFLFCPTEYCESRAVPNVSNSTYLKAIGAGLHPSIDIMWSGCRVVSRLITEESIEELTAVIRRPPLIWENLHANDYDKRRVFLGPYSGRSTKIIPKLRGVLTNPNCEYEANYIAIHTLAQWARCTEDINLHNKCGLGPEGDARTETGMRDSVYDPARALKLAISDWLPRVLERKTIPDGMNLSLQRSDEAASNQLAKESGAEVRGVELDVDNNVEMAVPEDTRSSGNSVASSKSDMDTSSSPSAPRAATLVLLADNDSCDSCEMQDATLSQDGLSTDTNANSTRDPLRFQLDAEGLNLLADLFYLPFEHGSYGCNLLSEIKWLIDNSDIMLNQNTRSDKDAVIRIGESESSEASARPATSAGVWIERASALGGFCARISSLVNGMIHNCPNKLLTSELYPYLAEMRDLIAIIIEYIKFLRFRTSQMDRFYNHHFNSGRQKENVTFSDEQEPWVHRGGLIGDIQRLLFMA